MHLIVINQFASTPKYSTGAGERFFFLAGYFKREGIHSTILSASYNHLFKEYPKTDGLFTREDIVGGKIIWVRVRKYNANSFLQRFWSWVEFLLKLFFIKLQQKPDLVLVSSMSLISFFYGYFLKLRYRVPLILEVRDIWPLTPISLGGFSKSNPFIWIMAQIEKFIYKKADHIVGLMPDFGVHVNEILGSSAKVSWIPNGFEPTLPESQYEFPFPLLKDKFIVVYTGAIGIANEIDFLIQAAELVQENTKIHFCIVGEGPEKNRLVLASEHLKNIHFVPKMTKGQVGEFLKYCSICFIGWQDKDVYRFGVSANKYNDYMFAGKPIISASNMINDPIQSLGCGIHVPAASSQEIAKAINLLFNMSVLERDLLGKKGLTFLLENQTYSLLGARYLAIINQLKQNRSHVI
jgi:glycosyltransferase involved in cell wall biosynthesis